MGMTIYDKSTGEARLCESVDGREIIESSPNLYSATPIDVADKPAKAEGDVLEGLKVADLMVLAADRGVDLGDATKKADIIAALELAAEAAAAK